MKLTYTQAMKLYSIVVRRPENKILLDLIAAAIYKEKNA